LGRWPEQVGVRVEISAQKSLRLELTRNVANQPITDRHQAAGVMPDRGARNDLQQPFTAAIPSIHLEAPPARARIGETLSQCWLTPADDAWTADRSGSAACRRVEQSGIETQAGDHADPMSHGVEPFDGSEAAIGHRDDLPLRKPACDLQHDLPAPVGELLCRCLCLRAYRSDGARTVKNGSAQMRPAQGISGRSRIESHRRPLALTK